MRTWFSEKDGYLRLFLILISAAVFVSCTSPGQTLREDVSSNHRVAFMTVHSHYQGRPSERDRVFMTFRNTVTGLRYSSMAMDGLLLLDLPDGPYELVKVEVWHVLGNEIFGQARDYRIEDAKSFNVKPLSFWVGSPGPALYLGSFGLNLFRPGELRGTVPPETAGRPATFRIQVEDRFQHDREAFAKAFSDISRRHPQLKFDYDLRNRALPSAYFLFEW